MSEIEHYIGLNLAAGYDETDLGDLVGSLRERSSVDYAVLMANRPLEGAERTHREYVALAESTVNMLGEGLDAARASEERLRAELEQGGAALGRATSLLHALYQRTSWNDRKATPGWPAELVALNIPGDWSHVLRWIDDELKEETTVDETPQVMEVANPAERSAAGIDPSLSRWRGFSDEELQELRAGAIERGGGWASNQDRERAGRLAIELRKVLKAREDERSSYRGPGRYRNVTGPIYEVLGTLGDLVIARSPLDGKLLSVTRRSFDDTLGDGRRIYEYLGPLEEEKDPDEVQRLKRVLRRIHNHDQATTDVRAIVESAIVFGDDSPELVGVDYVDEALKDALARAHNVVEAVAIVRERLQSD